MKRATIYDVAKAAGVSHQTVTRYLNGFEGIRPATRERVRKALAELDYRPNSAARFLRSQQTNRIGLLAHRMDLSGPGRLIAGATSAARERGYVLDIASMDGGDAASVDEALDLVLEHQIAGVFGTAQTHVVREAIEARALSVPIALDGQESGPGSVNVGLPGHLAAAHLAELGHRRVGFLSGPAVWIASAARRDGFLAEAAAAGLDVRWMGEGDWSAESGWAAAQECPVGEQGITAIAVSNDSMAVGLIAGLHERGIDVPGDVSVVGMDDSPESRFLVPALTTVRLDFEGEGAHRMARLIARIEDRTGSDVPEYDAPRLIVRQSTRAIAD
ncbi:LacI family transcriptional regulator [Leifsonia sp. LS1]|uniref:LacI family DNA-binding transcriptional regulator n=1 Tax=Leifsonia sp. LS1 TaxID=2828483 RepID=UPI001CFC6E0B|nr:LacI family DNA-binding transcriptional regulator [Leifsonia sp. LS1]GIT81320.1 LacI family transcriptional regulator [Leifsonia sp. LS1]